MSTLKGILTAIFVMIVPVICMAQPDGFTGFGGDAPVPLDGGLSLIVAGGIAYGAKKLNERRKQQAEAQQTDK